MQPSPSQASERGAAPDSVGSLGPPDRPASSGALERLARRRAVLAAALVAVVLLGLAARVSYCQRGLPYMHRWGETTIAGLALQILKTGDFNPHWFNYGAPTIYLHTAVDALHYLWLCGQPEELVRSLADVLTPQDTGDRWTMSHPSFVLWNRVTTALLGTGVVLLAFQLGRRVVGRWAAVLAAAVVASIGTHIDVSSSIRADMPAALVALGSVYCSVRFLEEERPRLLVASLFLAGFAAATKYNMAVVLVTPAAALAIAAAQRSAGYRPWLWWLVPALPALAFVLGNPFALLDLPSFLEAAGGEIRHYKQGGQLGYRVEPGLPHAKAQLGYLALDFGAGWPWLGALSLLVAALGAAHVARRRAGLVLFVFPLAYFLFMTRTRVEFRHNFVSLHPFVAIALAAGLERVHGALRARGLPRASVALVAVVALASTVQLGVQVGRGAGVARERETRTRAVDAVLRLARERGWKKVGFVSELHVHTLDQRRLASQGVECVELGADEMRKRRRELDALVAPSRYDFSERIKDSWSEIDPERNDPTMVASRKKWAALERRMDELNELTPREHALVEIPGGPCVFSILMVNPGVLVIAGSAP